MVGRDVLIGALAGCAVTIVKKLAILAPAWFGRPPLNPIRTYFTALTELRHLGFLLLNNLQFSIGIALLFAFIFLLMHVVFRSLAVATVLLALLFIVFAPADLQSPMTVAFECLAAIITVAVFRRYGLLSMTALLAFASIMFAAPLTLDTSVWYFGRGAFVMVLMSAVAAYAFWISLAAQPMFGLVLEEE